MEAGRTELYAVRDRDGDGEAERQRDSALEASADAQDHGHISIWQVCFGEHEQYLSLVLILLALQL